jgi:ADP-ribose pyrophosphatase
VPSPDATRKIFSGAMLGLTIERWGEREVEVVERADSVAIVAVDRDDRVTLVRQFRAPTRGRLLELPAGTIDEGEEPEATARRELEEETGLRGGEWRSGPTFWTSPGFCAERIHLFFAERLEPGQPNPQGAESIELVRWPVTEIASRLGEVEDGKTLAGLLLYIRSGG